MFKDLCNGLPFGSFDDLLYELNKINNDNKKKIMSVNTHKKCDTHDFYIFN